MPVELLPCPHCGSEAVFRHDGSSGTDMVYVECLKCECVTKYKQLEVSAAKIWNQRASLVEGLPQADNSDYAAALRVISEMSELAPVVTVGSLKDYCVHNQRLHSSTNVA